MCCRTKEAILATNKPLVGPASFELSNLVLLVAAGLLFLSFGYTEMAGSDMWWHIAAGRELVQTGTLWMVDDWSFSAHGEDWHNHEWLADLLYYGWVSAWGEQSLVYWKWLVIIATFTLLLTTLVRESGSSLAALVGTGFALATAAPFLDVRPHLYSLLLFSLLLHFCLRRRTATWLLALCFVVWVNLHGGFFFGLMALGILLFPWRELNLDNFRVALVTGLLCLAACLLNPYGIKAFLYPLAYAFDGSSPFRGLAEWMSPFKPGGIRSPLFFYLMWAPLAGLLYCLPRVRRELDVPWEGIVLTALTLAMALTSRRFIPLFGMSLALMMTPLLALLFRWQVLQKLRLGLAVLALLFSMLRMVPYNVQAAPNFHYLTAEYSYPVEMANFIEANGISGNVYALYNWGGYLHWRSDGELKVFIDGRADTLYDDQTYLQYLSVLGSREGWLEQLEASGADYVLWPHRRADGQGKLNALLATGRWSPVYSDTVSWLLARTSAVLPDPVPSPPGPWRDLSIGRLSAWAGNYEDAILYAQSVLEQMPWHKGACELLIESYRRLGENDKADQVLFECRTYFPTRYLR